MSSVVAAQLIYAHVDASHSPSKRGGYQTLFRTSAPGLALSDREVSDIEARLFLRDTTGTVRKRVFFPLVTDKWVIGQIVPLVETDEFGRTGRCMAHVLVLTGAELAKLDHNPFGLLRTFPFFSTPEQALEQGDVQTGSIAAREIQVPALVAPSDAAVGMMSREAWWPLCLLALRSSRLQEQHQAIGFYGEPDRMFDLLEALFSMLWGFVRCLCSFDTAFATGNIIRQPYWAVGLPVTEPRSPDVMPFHLAERRFVRTLELTPCDNFERWLQRQWDSGMPLAACAQEAARRHAAVRVAEALLSGAAVSDPSDADPEVLSSVLTADHARLRRCVETHLERRVGPVLAQSLSLQALAWLQSTGAAMVQHLCDGLQSAPVEHWMVERWFHTARRPTPEELADLERFVSHGPAAPELVLLSCRWTRRWQDLSDAVDRLDDDQFLHFAEWALQTIQVKARLAIYRRRNVVFAGVRAQVEEAQDADGCELLSALLGLPQEKSRTASHQASGRFGWLWGSKPHTSQDGEWLAAPPRRMAIFLRLLQKYSAATLSEAGGNHESQERGGEA